MECYRQYADEKDIPVFGFTATDEYTDRSVEDYFESKVYELTKPRGYKTKDS
ncbi:MAG: hypothetical protein WDN66_04340 [Candidatus Saccharibacteria bacterium]